MKLRIPSARPAATLLALAIGAAGAGILAERAAAQQTAQPAAPAAAPAQNTLLSSAEIEQKVTAAGLRIEDIELYDRVAEVEGRDASGQEVEWLIDRRNGEVLSRAKD